MTDIAQTNVALCHRPVRYLNLNSDTLEGGLFCFAQFCGNPPYRIEMRAEGPCLDGLEYE
jgi:hypothetical protein